MGFFLVSFFINIVQKHLNAKFLDDRPLLVHMYIFIIFLLFILTFQFQLQI